MALDNLIGLVLFASVAVLAAAGSFWIFRRPQVSADRGTLGAVLGILAPVILLIVLVATYELFGWPQINE
jgi:hypothetical protein